jgi:hypothetical protein
MTNPFSALKAEAVALYHKYDGHQEILNLMHKVLAELEAFVEKEAPVVGAAVGGALGGPVGALAGAAAAEAIKEEAPRIGAAVEQKVDAEVPK